MTRAALRRQGVFAAVWVSLAVSVAAQPPAQGRGPSVAIDNCGVSVSTHAPPTRVVTMNQATTEIMLALGLERVLVGTAYLDGPVLPQFAAAYAHVPVLAAQYPSREVLLAARPDFVYAAYSSAFAADAAGARDELVRFGARTYLSPAGCGSSATRTPFSMAVLYGELRDVGRIFNVSPRAERLIADLQADVDAIRSRIGVVSPRPRVFWYDSGDPPSAGACCGVPNEIIRLAQAENVFADAPGSWTDVSWEAVVARNPGTIVLADALWSPADVKRRLLNSARAYASIDAVKQQRYVVVDFGASTPGIRIVQAVRTLAQALYPAKFR